MAEQKLNKIFLSASIPTLDRDRKFYDTADIIAIRDAVRALATIAIPKAELIWGGHPAITPLIRYVIQQMNADVKKHVTLYQSLFFEAVFPPDNFDFENIELIPKREDLLSSLDDMRHAMIGNNDFKVGIFIGGMEGIRTEYELFKFYHPEALVLPVASTGAAAKLLYQDIQPAPPLALLQNYAYMDLFQGLLKDYL
ncbi:hypothetical protein [Mucilaginibacter flavus]|uniref:SLOG domain-containing protein n=1 Tax=Mucilaginibacter flavus TaxID=931504 RepID=UPI0025B4708F|nr:hypothetical protein [Mucilaginibacter flavus]MDN3582496.1 hypothetical protein [Mucilaginibacter flavus]